MIMDKKLAVIALGGNALLRGDQVGTIDEQEQNTTDTLENLLFLIREGYDLVITHEADGVTRLSGPVADQSALLGLLRRLHDLGLTLISVTNAVDWKERS